MNTSFKNVLILRTIIALCKYDAKLPNIFYDWGYRQILVEQPIGLSDRRTVVPDLIISSRQQNHCIVWESKSGGSIDNDQAKRLALIEAKDFRDKLSLDISLEEDFLYDISYACEGAECQNIKVDLDRLSKETAVIGDFPIVGFFDEFGVRKYCSLFKKKNVDDLLSAGIEVDIRKITPDYYPFDKDSPLYEIAPFVMRGIVSYAARGEPYFSSEQITRESCGSSWNYVRSNQAKNQMISKVEDILTEAKRNELKHYLSKHGKGDIRAPKWHVDYSNIRGTAYPAGKLKTLQKKCRQFVNRLRTEATGVKQLEFRLFLEED